MTEEFLRSIIMTQISNSLIPKGIQGQRFSHQSQVTAFYSLFFLLIFIPLRLNRAKTSFHRRCAMMRANDVIEIIDHLSISVGNLCSSLSRMSLSLSVFPHSGPRLTNYMRKQQSHTGTKKESLNFHRCTTSTK